MEAGALRQRVTIQARTETVSSTTGTITPAWSTVHQRKPARVTPLQGRELERARQFDPRISHEVTLRYWRDYAADLTAQHRIVYHDLADRTFEIIGPPINVNEARVEIRVQCAERR